MEATETHIAEPLPNYNSVSFGGMLANGVQPMLSISAMEYSCKTPPAELRTHACPIPAMGSLSSTVFQPIAPSRTRCCPAPALSATLSKAGQGRCRLTATPRSWAGRLTVEELERRGFLLAAALLAAVLGTSKAKAGRHRNTGSFSGQGASAALSSDGNTAIVGAPYDNYNLAVTAGVGAAWIFTRSGSTWTQQAKLIGSEVDGYAGQGLSVGLSDDGNVSRRRRTGR